MSVNYFGVNMKIFVSGHLLKQKSHPEIRGSLFKRIRNFFTTWR